MKTNVDQAKTRRVREITHSHPLAPQYHFICPEGIRGPFDPNGAIFWKGRYHLLDKSIVEVYANRRQCVTQRIYPTRLDSLGVAVFGHGGSATVHSVQAWELRP